jgi:signal transduction histidine kinase
VHECYGRLVVTRSPLGDAQRALTIAVLYVVVAKLGLMMDAVSGFATLVWPPTGLSLAALVLLGPHVWPGVMLGAFVVNAWTGAPPLVAFGMALGNTVEGVVGAYALRRFPSFSPRLERLRDTLALIVIAALGSTTLSATIGVGCLWLGGVITSAAAGDTWRAWWLGDVIGDLVVAPFLLTMLATLVARPPERSKARAMRASRRVELAVLGAMLTFTALFIFLGPVGSASTPFRQAYFLFPLLIWAALRFGPRGAAAATFAVSVAAIAGTAAGAGPFVKERLSQSLLFLQTFMAFVAVTMLVLGAVSAERRQALALRDTLISLASHELRTPLTALQLQVQLLAQGLRELAPADADAAQRLSDDAATAERYVKRMVRLVDELLDVSRITAGRLQLDPEEVDLGALVREVVDRSPQQHRSKITLEEAGTGPIVGLWDRMRVEQIVTNLISNATKYGDGKPVQVTVERQAKAARLVVKDHGVGIAREDQARIFERFERGTVDSRSGVGGFGLGLWIVRQVVEALGGSVQLESEVGKGSTFTVMLPMTDAVPKSKEGR